MNLKLYKEYYIKVNEDVFYSGLFKELNKDSITLIEVEIDQYYNNDYIDLLNIPFSDIMELWEVETNKRIF